LIGQTSEITPAGYAVFNQHGLLPLELPR
jgi:hypothetical protein